LPNHCFETDGFVTKTHTYMRQNLQTKSMQTNVKSLLQQVS